MKGQKTGDTHSVCAPCAHEEAYFHECAEDVVALLEHALEDLSGATTEPQAWKRAQLLASAGGLLRSGIMRLNCDIVDQTMDQEGPVAVEKEAAKRAVRPKPAPTGTTPFGPTAVEGQTD